MRFAPAWLTTALILGACAGTSTATDDDGDATEASPCPVPESSLSPLGPPSTDTALDSGELDTGIAYTPLTTIEACVEPEVTMTGWVSLALRRKKQGDIVCDMLYPIVSAEPLDSCPHCDFAFTGLPGPLEEMRVRRKVLGRNACLTVWDQVEELGPKLLGVNEADQQVSFVGGTEWFRLVTESFSLTDVGEGVKRLSTVAELPPFGEGGPSDPATTDTADD